MNAIVPGNFGQLSTRFAPPASAENDLAAGISAGYGLIGYRGKVWSIKHRGEEIQLMRDDGDGPRGSIEVVLLKASSHISKIFYEAGYVEGASEAPDCFSTNGIVPDASVAKPQCTNCANCPMNAWGSRVTPAGKAGKRCSDSKRVAVVPATDLRNEAFGGPLLLRIPAASLQDLAGYGTKLGQMGYPYYAVATRVSFDPAEAYPKFVFGAIRPLTDAEADVVIELQKDIQVQRVLAESGEFGGAPAQAAPPPAAAAFFEQPPQAAPVAPAPVQSAPVAQPAPAPVVTQPAGGGFVPTTSSAAPQPVAAPPTAAVPQVTQMTGFGRVAPVAAAPAAAAPASAPTNTAMPLMPDPSMPATTEAEADLDAKLNALLTPA